MTLDAQQFETEANPYKRMWHRLVVEIIGAHDPSDVTGMQNNPAIKQMARIEKEELHGGESKDRR